ncbi:hypothetical protein ABZ651_21885, partial [Streptomyces sp. NPDC007070]
MIGNSGIPEGVSAVLRSARARKARATGTDWREAGRGHGTAQRTGMAHPEVFGVLERTPPGRGGEIQLT